MTLQTDIIQTPTGGPVELTGQSAAKSWTRIDMNAGVIADSFNLSSIVDIALGRYSQNFTNPMVIGTYAVTGMSSRKANSLAFHFVGFDEGANPNIYGYRLRNCDHNGNDKDSLFVSTMVLGDLA